MNAPSTKNCSYRELVMPMNIIMNLHAMRRYGPDHLGVADDWNAALEKRQRRDSEEQRKANNSFSCDWVSARLNVGDYGASKATPIVSGEWVYVGTDQATLLKLSRVDGKVLLHLSPLLSLCYSTRYLPVP